MENLTSNLTFTVLGAKNLFFNLWYTVSIFSGNLYHLLQTDAWDMIQYVGPVYGIFLLLTVAFIMFKRRFGAINYRSKTGMAILIYNIIQFIVGIYLCIRFLWTLYNGIRYNDLDSIDVTTQFMTIVLTSMYAFIPRGRFPSLSEIYVDHLQIILAIFYRLFWRIRFVGYMLSHTIVLLLSPFFGPRAYYLTIVSRIFDIIYSLYLYYISTRPLRFNTYIFIDLFNFNLQSWDCIIYGSLALYFITCIIVCIFEIRKHRESDTEFTKKSINEYEEKIKRYIDTIKNDKTKIKDFKRAVEHLRKQGYNIPVLTRMAETLDENLDQNTSTQQNTQQIQPVVQQEGQGRSKQKKHSRRQRRINKIKAI